MNNRLLRSLPFFLCIVFIFYSGCKASIQDGIENFFIASILIAEFSLLTLLLVKLKNKLALFITSFFAVILVCQLFHYFNTGVLFLTLTLENAATAGAMPKKFLIKNGILIIVFVSLWVSSVYLFRNKKNKQLVKDSQSIAFCVSAIVLLILLDQSSLGKFLITLKESYENFTSDISYNGEKFKRDKVLIAGNVPQAPLSSWNGNVILIFAEGLSYTVVTDDLTPNVKNLEKKSLSFANYYNHTAATYRGIRGQLISGFQQLAGFNAEKNGLGQSSASSVYSYARNGPESLPFILNQFGYQTVFLSPHLENDNFNYFLRGLGFQKVISPTNQRLSDKALYSKLLDLALDLENNNKKFFLATYVFGTHEGLDSPDLKFKTGKDPYLNKFHNSDYWLGKFLTSFDNSKLAKNTLIIFTTDHSSFQSAPFLQAFKERGINGKLGNFVDKIPLFFYTPYIKPQVINVSGRNSLGLAPTILHILGIREVPNHFLGSSLFGSSATPLEYCSAIGKSFYYTKNNSTVHKKHLNEDLEKILLYYKFSG